MAATHTRWCEFPIEPPALVPETRDFPLAEPIEAEDGCVRPPEGPGLGIELAPEVRDEVGLS
jgi:L-alanine-DL-glutamate epimerase-like enolase superfamily enzyme